MCIGIPMRVVRAEAGHALCSGRGQTARVDTALVGAVAPGDWLLVFIDSARERIDAARAAEIDALLDWVGAALDGAAPTLAEPAFELPSRWTAAQLRALSGAPAEAEGPP